MGAWTSPNPRLLTCSCASSGGSWPRPRAVSTTSKPYGAGATSCASPNHSRWQADSDHPSEQYEPGGIGGHQPCSRVIMLISAVPSFLGLLWMIVFERLQPLS